MRLGLARWLNSFSDLVGVVELRETRMRKLRRIRRELKRVGLLRVLDVLAMRLYYRLYFASDDQAWERTRLMALQERYPCDLGNVPVLVTPSPNTKEVEQFLGRVRPDLSFAICKTILRSSVYSIATTGTWVFHPGVCPEYRNAHGCFWALAQRDLDRVGMTLLRIDDGVDTGPVYGYFSYPFDETTESHVRIQRRVVFDNLEAIRDKLVEVLEGTAEVVDTTGRKSATWGQPWLSRFLRWKRAAQEGAISP